MKNGLFSHLVTLSPCHLVIFCAAVLTGLNAIKPLHVDDTTYYFDAAQIAAHPFDPYGHVLLYFSDPLPALHVLAPPLLLYWWAGAIRLFGESPLPWKICLFPFTLLFVSGLFGLLRRFAAGVRMPLLIALVLSPVFLPSLNMMIDIPALALSLASLWLFFRACDNESPVFAVLAGLIAGLAMQTKYTAFLSLPVLFAYSLFQRKLRLGFAAALAAGLIFTSWETVLLLRYGESHFLYRLSQSGNVGEPKILLLGSLFPLLGGAVPTLALLALTVLSAPRWLLLAAAVLMVLPFQLLVCPESLSCGGRLYELADALFACNGAAALLSTGWAAWRLVATSGPLVRPMDDHQRGGCFLVHWLALEIVGYLAISPFPAVRRIMGTAIAATLVIGWLAGRSQLEAWRKNLLHGLVVVTALLGLGFFAVDYLEARSEQQAAYDAAQFIGQLHSQARIWYAGYWGFQYYAEKCGMKQIVPARNGAEEMPALLAPSRCRRGDWLVIPDDSIPQQELDLNRPELEPQGQLAFDDAIPLSTLMNYYAGAAPLRHRRGPRIVLRLFRVKDDFIAR
jgi:hypothetical protein